MFPAVRLRRCRLDETLQDGAQGHRRLRCFGRDRLSTAYIESFRGHSSAGRAPALQAGGHRFDPGWLHPQNPCVHAGFDTAGSAPELAASGGWKRFGSRPSRTHRSISLRTPRVSPAGSGAEHRRWCRWIDLSPNAEAATRHEPKPYISPPPKSVRARMTSPSYPPRRAKRGPSTRPRASEPKRTGSVRRWVSALLDFDPSVSPQGEAGGDEAAAKAPRWIKHDRGQSESPQRRTRTAPVRTAAAPTIAPPVQGGRSVPTPAARAIRQPIRTDTSTRSGRQLLRRRRGSGDGEDAALNRP
jgi:hypothetical protein